MGRGPGEQNLGKCWRGCRCEGQDDGSSIPGKTIRARSFLVACAFQVGAGVQRRFQGQVGICPPEPTTLILVPWERGEGLSPGVQSNDGCDVLMSTEKRGECEGIWPGYWSTGFTPARSCPRCQVQSLKIPNIGRFPDLGLGFDPSR